jgi:hypothetical protein
MVIFDMLASQDHTFCNYSDAGLAVHYTFLTSLRHSINETVIQCIQAQCLSVSQ